MNNPIFKICAWCQGEYPTVDTAVKQGHKSGTLNASHGICAVHYYKQLLSMGKSEEESKLKVSKLVDSVPNLSQHPELVQAYSQGNFFPQQQLKERLQKLANIKK